MNGIEFKPTGRPGQTAAYIAGLYLIATGPSGVVYLADGGEIGLPCDLRRSAETTQRELVAKAVQVLEQGAEQARAWLAAHPAAADDARAA